MKPRWSTWVACSVSLRYRVESEPTLKRPKPRAQNAAIDERIVAIFFSRANAASIEIGAGSASSMTSPSTSSFSN